jgi:hypothetical protein
MVAESEILDHDDESYIPEMFRTSSGLLDSLDKLTNEIKEDILSLEGTESETGSNESSNNDDEFDSDDEDNEYSDDEDPESGETTLFSMMDELVMELQKELEEGGGDDVAEDEGNNDDADDKKVEQRACTAQTGDNEKKEDDRVEKHIKLHENVKTLLKQVTEMKKSVTVASPTNTKNKDHDKISANIQRKIEQGDFDADRLEHLMGAISTHVNTNTTKTRFYNKIKNQKRRKRTNKHKKRKQKQFLEAQQQTQQQSLRILFDSLLTLDQKLSRETLSSH